MKKTIIITIIAGILLLSGVSNMTAFHFANDIIPVFPEPDAGEIEETVIDGASSYFKASADIMNLFAEQEKSVYNLSGNEKSVSLINSAITYLEVSKSKYLEASSNGKKSGYIIEKVNILKNFNYERYAEESKLNMETMNQVRTYLSAGNVSGFYKYISDEIEEILAILYSMKNALEENKQPDLPVFWNLLQKVSKTTLFGNYGTVTAQRAFGNY